MRLSIRGAPCCRRSTIAEYVYVPRDNLLPKPAGMSWEVAACLPTAWLTAYKMLFAQADVAPGQTILVQGAGGGVTTALIQLGAAAGLRVWVASRSAERGERALALGADQAFETGARLPDRVDAVMETVGAATWSHSLKCLRPGGTMVISGATSGHTPERGELNRIFFQQLRVIGSTMGTRQQLSDVANFVMMKGLAPQVYSVHDLDDAATGFAELLSGEVFGKVLIRGS